MILTVFWAFSLSEKGGSVMLRLDELSGEVAGLEKLRANLEMVQRLQKLEDETDSWLRFQEFAELLEAPGRNRTGPPGSAFWQECRT